MVRCQIAVFGQAHCGCNSAEGMGGQPQLSGLIERRVVRDRVERGAHRLRRQDLSRLGHSLGSERSIPRGLR